MYKSGTCFSSSGFWYDSRLRCDVVDLYYEMYGKKKPVSVPLPELAALRPQKVEKPRGEKDVSSMHGGTFASNCS